MAEDLDRLYQPQPEEGFDEFDRAAASLDEGDARAFLSDADADDLWGDDDTADWRDAMDERGDDEHDPGEYVEWQDVYGGDVEEYGTFGEYDHGDY